MELKQYQRETLWVLRRFLEDARVAGPASAYEAITAEPEQAARLGRFRGAYRELESLPDAPYICLRLPTGGGKTILGAHAIAVARDGWIEKDFPLVLWLVPSNTIRLQTAEALKNPRHAYRRVLDEQFGGRVRIFDIADFTTIRPHDIRDNCCVVVGTIQTLRVSNTEGRRVYAHNEEMEPHFSELPRNASGLEQHQRGGPKFSFANLLHVHRPLMIVDEAQNAVTGLSREMQARVNPCAIVEFTATPRTNSNILHSVSAQELKLAEMIKLPIVLAEHDTWQNAVNGAIANRSALAEAAKGETDYLRPIILFQAQPRNGEVTVATLRKHLIETEQIAENRIAVATGDQRELDGIDLFDPSSLIEYVITVEALKEGWDCSFAYVFCSVQRIQSATDAEQLLGRVLRMPYAAARKEKALNRAYAHVSEPSFGAAANALVDRLVEMGFEEEEARDAVEPAQGHLDDTGLFGSRERPKSVFRHEVAASQDLVTLLSTRDRENVALRFTKEGRHEISVTGRVDPELEEDIAAILPEQEGAGFREAVRKYRLDIRDALSPAELGERFVVAGLAAEVQGELQLVDTDLLMEDHDWSLTDYPAKLGEGEFAIRDEARSFEIDIDGKQLAFKSAGIEQQLMLNVDVEGWTAQNLVLWLDRELRQPDIHQTDMVKWLADCIGYLAGPRKLTMPALMRAKFLLARKLREKIAAVRLAERKTVYQRELFGAEARIVVSLENGFVFRDGMYRDLKRHRYEGRFRFGRHFLGADNVPAFDGADGGEEFQCAQALDSLPGVRLWLRNVARHLQSFWLPTASDKFYPDFVAELADGRTFVVEYKGALMASGAFDDTNEKRVVGRLWEQHSGGKGLFLVVEKSVGGRDMRGQLLDKISG